MKSLRSDLMTSSGKNRASDSLNPKKFLLENEYIFVVINVSADGLVPLGARKSASTLLTK